MGIITTADFDKNVILRLKGDINSDNTADIMYETSPPAIIFVIYCGTVIISNIKVTYIRLYFNFSRYSKEILKIAIQLIISVITGIFIQICDIDAHRK